MWMLLSFSTLLLVLSYHLTDGMEQCFFDESKVCDNYCCRGSEYLYEYCCSDCTKSHSQACYISNVGMIVGITFGVIVFLVFVGTLIVLCVIGCICTSLTGRQPYKNGRVIRAPPANTATTTTIASGNASYPTNNYPTVQTVSFPSAPPSQPPPPYPYGSGAPYSEMPVYATNPQYSSGGFYPPANPGYGGAVNVEYAPYP